MDLVADPVLLKGDSMTGSAPGKAWDGYRGLAAYFFSGTGNSYRVAVWMARFAAARGMESRVAPVRNYADLKSAPSGPDRLLVLATPTHGFTAPWPAIRFALVAPFGRGTHAVVVACRAGLKWGRLFIPGLDGTAAYLPALILALKGYRVRGAIGIDMPSNWMAVHSGLKPANAAAIIDRAREKTDRFIGRILEGRAFFGSWASFPAGLLLAPVSLAYLLYGRFGLAKLFFASNRCNGCGLCAKRCSEGAIRMYLKMPYWTWRCESCMRCMAFCPKEAVEVSHSLSVLMGILTMVCPPLLVVLLLGDRMPVVVVGVASYAAYLAVTFALYAVFAAAIRIPAVNALFRWTTFTPLFRRYHEPDTNVDEMNPHGEGRS